MAETPDIGTVHDSMSLPGTMENELYHDHDDMAPIIEIGAEKLTAANNKQLEYHEEQEDDHKPARVEVFSWYLYEFCSYFVNSVLIPIVFPLLISQIVSPPPEPEQGWGMSSRGLVCTQKEMKLFQSLTLRSIKVNNSKLSPLEWTSISWVIGLILVAPILGSISFHLDNGLHQPSIAAASVAIGVLFCLPVGFFKTQWTFPLYIAVIVAGHTVARTCHTRHLGLMIRGFTGPTLHKRQFPLRRAHVSGWLSLYATAAGCAGAAIISAFTLHMLREPIDHDQEFSSLWVLSIFSGLMWLFGILHVFTSAARICSADVPFQLESNDFSIFKYPHAIGSLVGVFLSSFTTMCILTGGLLFIVGQLCLKPMFLLCFLFIYFMFPLFSLPLLQLLQNLIKADLVKMQILGFFLSTTTTAVGFYFRKTNWQNLSVLLFAAIQGTSTGLLHAFGRAVLLDCSPLGKEGAFSIWFSWIKALGTLAGFTVASTVPGKIGTTFGAAFCAALLGIFLLIFGNISDLGGAVAAGNVRDDGRKRGSPHVHSKDTGADQSNESMHGETP